MKRERTLPRLIIWADPRRSPSRAIVAALAAGFAFLASACQPPVPAASAPTHESTLGSATSAHPIPLAASPTSPAAPDSAAVPSPVAVDQIEGACPAEGNLLGDEGFTSDLEGWGARYGLLRHTVRTYVGEPGAALLVTSHAGPDGGMLAVAGRCLDLDPGATSQSVTLETYLLAMPETESVSLSVFFHREVGCRGEVLEVVGPPVVTSDSGWTLVTQSFTIPRGAAAADLVVRAVSQSDSGRALFDRVCAYWVPNPN